MVTTKPSLIVAIEGLDGSGKSTTVRRLAERLGAVVIRNPPSSLAAERHIADGLAPHERRAWYLNANRVAMEEALAVVDRWVVLDRSIASTLAFGAAERSHVAVRSDVPSGFRLPDEIVLLTLPEALRRARHNGRGDKRTSEEDRLATDDAFREGVLAGYANLCTAKVDASADPTSVVDAIVRLLGAG